MCQARWKQLFGVYRYWLHRHDHATARTWMLTNYTTAGARFINLIEKG